MRVLVTGATGFLGRHTVVALLARGHTVRAIGRDRHRLDDLSRLGAEAVAVDIRDDAGVRLAAQDCAAVVHSAALSAPWGRAADFHSINVQGTTNVLAAGAPRVIHVSSPAVVFADRDIDDATEDMPYPARYSSHYAATKADAERLVRAWKGDWLILRPKAIFGPGDTSLLPRLIAAARAGRLPIIGTGTNRVDLTYVANVADALVLAVESPLSGRIYTITNGEHVPLWPLVERVLESQKIAKPGRRIPLWLARWAARVMEWRALLLGGEPLLTRYTAAVLGTTQTYDITAARRDLGYSPRVSVEEGVARTLESAC